MALNFCFDTTFLIDLQKERGRGAAHTFLGEHSEAGFFCSVIVLGEFAEGFPSSEDPVLRQYLHRAAVLEITIETALVYGRITRRLRRSGKLVGSNDLWIASHALQHRLPLVTNDEAHFGRVPNLRLMSY